MARKYMVMVMSVVDAEDENQAALIGKRAFSHTPMGGGAFSGFEVEDGCQGISAKVLMSVGKWLTEVYPGVMSSYKRDNAEMNSWGKFLCEAEEGVVGE